jgi:hypothetical protein
VPLEAQMIEISFMENILENTVPFHKMCAI